MKLRLCHLGMAMAWLGTFAASADSFAWPPITRECRPGGYWWWMASAVDTNNLSREMQRYHDAGMGAVHIIPIYGAKGWEEKYIPYLSPQWMAMLRHTVTEGQRLDLNVDMTTGTGWCFGGPRVTAQEANAAVVVNVTEVKPGARLLEKFDRKSIQALMAFSPDGKALELTGKIGVDGMVAWVAEGGPWTVYAVSQKPSGQKVKRAAPGGEGHMLNLFYADGMKNYLRWFDEAFAGYQGPKPRAVYHDSYEYRSDWAPDLFTKFAQRRGYRLEQELPALFGKATNEHTARIKCDYRETISDLMAEETMPLWTAWAKKNGFLTRNEAHGSPGNLLDLYALADIPESEMFFKDRNKLISKFASSSAHVAGRALVANETGTWLQEHFTETLGDMKYLLDDLFVSGINHIFYHGTCYSPDEAEWPGWVFYAAFEMNPRNSVWQHVSALNAYAARCQSILQAGRPDNDVLLYWPIYDYWQTPGGRVLNMTVHARDWFEAQPLGKAAEHLWNRGYAFDYISDRQLAGTTVAEGRLKTAGAAYRVVVVPRCQVMHLPTFEQLVALAEAGATVIFEGQLPTDVPGWGNLETRRAALHKTLARLQPGKSGDGVSQTIVGKGRVVCGDLEAALAAAQVGRESLVDHAGLYFIRRTHEGGRHYFIANRSEQPVTGWVPLNDSAVSVVLMDPMNGQTGLGALHKQARGGIAVYLDLTPGASMVLRTFNTGVTGEPWPYQKTLAPQTTLTGSWQVTFLQGGPELPAPFQTDHLASWTELGGTNAQRFAGTARYTLSFDAPPSSSSQWILDLGRVCQSARVYLNGRDLGTLFIPPFQVSVGPLKPTGNQLEIEVVNVSANRIRDLDRRKVKWQNFHDINFVNLDYKPFDASNWPLTDSGLLGPVTLTPAGPKPIATP
ncbi:MAG: glycosyl hydrolase [Verrucomicrobiota bacterium]